MGIEHDLLGKTPRKKGINSKKKGDRNENELAKFLTKWSGHRFKRVPASGGLHWKDSVQTVGDLVCIDDVYIPFVIETKHYKKLGLNNLVLRSNSRIFNFWEQSIQEAKDAKRIPLLFVRENGMPKNTWIVFMTWGLGKSLIKDTYLTPIIFPKVEHRHHIMGFRSNDLINIDFKKLSEKLCLYLKAASD